MLFGHHFAIHTCGRTIITLLITVFLLIAAAPALAQDETGGEPDTPPPVPVERTPTSAADYYGLNFIQPHEPWLSIARQSGVGTVRWQFNWRDAEVSPGVYAWGASDEPVRTWNSAGFRIHAILHNPPDWAKANSGGLVPKNFALSWDDPANGWGQFCFRFAERYRGQIASYEIWNEPDLNQFWEGTPEEYYALMRTCYKAIRAADPSTPISMAGMALLVERSFFPTVVRLAAEDPEGAANNYFFDAANIHMYADPDLVYSLTVYTRRILSTYGLDYKPIWITETNVALKGHGRFLTADWGHVTEEEQSWYVLQAAANSFASGAERLMFFRLADDGMDEAFGLVHQTGDPRPGYKSLQLATSLMHDIVEARREIRENVIITHLLRADGARIVVLYSEAGTPLNLEIEARQAAAVIVNSAGEYTTISAEGGLYTVSVPPANGRDLTRQHAVGGPVVILVEQDSQPPNVVADLQEVPGDESHVLLRMDGDDGPLGTGISSYEIEVSIDGGPWESWQAGIAESEALFDISQGGSFAFRVRAIDRAGNLGEYSNIVSTTLIRQGTLVMQITDLREQPVPYARVTLSDGTLHDADSEGIVRITAEPGLVHVAQIDGSGQGRLAPDQPFEIELAEESTTSWMLLPSENLVQNGQFDFGSQGWLWSSPADVQTIDGPERRGDVLQIRGRQRPWGSPGVSVAIDIPPGMTASMLSFYYRTPEPGSVLRVRAITPDSQAVLWESTSQIGVFDRVWADLSRFAGQHVTLRFELVSGKNGPDGLAEIDDVIVGNVPVLP